MNLLYATHGSWQNGTFCTNSFKQNTFTCSETEAYFSVPNEPDLALYVQDIFSTSLEKYYLLTLTEKVTIYLFLLNSIWPHCDDLTLLAKICCAAHTLWVQTHTFIVRIHLWIWQLLTWFSCHSRRYIRLTLKRKFDSCLLNHEVLHSAYCEQHREG